MAGKKIPQIYCSMIKIDDLAIYMASSKNGAVRTGITLEANPDCVEYFKALFPESNISKSPKMNNALAEAIDKKLHGTAAESVPVDLGITEFQREILERIAMIPFGETRTYGDIARITGRPGGARAIGQVMNKNPLPVIYP
jgi:O6-methylguanine-DNA--protein-cysteine methyltransferase